MKKQIVIFLIFLLSTIGNIQAVGNLARDTLTEAGINPEELKIGRPVFKNIGTFPMYKIGFGRIGHRQIGILLPSIFQGTTDKRCGFFTYINSYILGMNDMIITVLDKLNDMYGLNNTERRVNNLVKIFDVVEGNRLKNTIGVGSRKNLGMWTYEMYWLNDFVDDTCLFQGSRLSLMDLLAIPDFHLFRLDNGALREELARQLPSFRSKGKYRAYIDPNRMTSDRWLQRTCIFFDKQGQLSTRKELDTFSDPRQAVETSIQDFQEKIWPEIYIVATPDHLFSVRAENVNIEGENWTVLFVVDSACNKRSMKQAMTVNSVNKKSIKTLANILSPEPQMAQKYSKSRNFQSNTCIRKKRKNRRTYQHCNCNNHRNTKKHFYQSRKRKKTRTNILQPRTTSQPSVQPRRLPPQPNERRVKKVRKKTRINVLQPRATKLLSMQQLRQLPSRSNKHHIKKANKPKLSANIRAWMK